MEEKTTDCAYHEEKNIEQFNIKEIKSKIVIGILFMLLLMNKTLRINTILDLDLLT